MSIRTILLALAGLVLGASTALAAPPSPNSSVSVDYWVVVVSPKARPSPAAVRDASERSLAAAISALEERAGSLSVELVEHVALTSKVGQPGKAKGAWVDISQLVVKRNGQFEANLKIDPNGPNRVETSTPLRPGRVTLIGETGYFEGGAPSAVGSKRIYYFAKLAERSRR